MSVAKFRRIAIFLLTAAACPATLHSAETLPVLDDYVVARAAEFEKIPAERRRVLEEIAAFGRAQRTAGRPIRLTFICTHNSRRSQMAQVWATLAADHYGIAEVEAFSGGTEGTAFNPRAVAALKRADVKIDESRLQGDAENPRYVVWSGRERKRLVCFSKVYNEAPNPKSDFAAVMTCSEAEKDCPIVTGAAARISLPYEDPKVADGTADEAKTYDKRCAQIAREMLFVFYLTSSSR